MPSGRRKVQSPQSHDYNNGATLDDDPYTDPEGRNIDEIKTETRQNETNGNYSDEEIPYNETQETTANSTYRRSNDATDATNDNYRESTANDESRGMNGGNTMDKHDYMDSVNLVKNANKKEKGGLYSSPIISGLMDQYLNNDYGYNEAPPIKPKPTKLSDGNQNNLEELENNLKNLEVSKKKRAPPPVRHKPPPGHKTWNDPRDQQRPKAKEKHWPPREAPKDIGAYVAESYGQTDPYSNRLIKDIQKSKREEEEKRAAEKRAEIVADNIQPVSALRSAFTHKPTKPRPGMLRPEANLAEERSWIKHEKKPMVFDTPPDEPDWMRLIRNRRWNSTVKARFPCKASDKSEFERRSTTPKNWKRLAQDKNALKMLSEVVGIGAEGEELFMRLASQRQKMEEEQEKIDRLAEEELMAYEVARESLGEDAAYSLQMDNPLPAARMLHLGPHASIVEGGSEAGSEGSDTAVSSSNVSYPFTTSQLEAAYLTNQLLRLHPEEFKKLMSLERSRQATLRWQFSSDPFDSVHEHQSLPYEIAMLASQEPRVQQAMRRILAQGDTEEYYGSVFGNSKPRSRMARSEGYASRYESDQEGYESSSSVGVARGRPRKKAPVPPPKNARGRSVSPAMMGRKAHENHDNGLNLKIPEDDGREIQSHGLFSDEDLLEGLNDEVAQIDQLTSNLARNIDDELASIESSLEDRKRGFFEEALRSESVQQSKDVNEVVDKAEISSRRKDFAEKARRSSLQSDPADEVPKQRHKVRRINSNAELNAVFRKRRQASECDGDGEDQGVPNEKTKLNEKQQGEMNDLIQNISNTFGNE